MAYAPTIIVGARVTFDFIETAVSKCSGNPMYYIPLANEGGVATSIVVANSGEEISTFLSFNHFRFTLK